jgi:hypothetical protein
MEFLISIKNILGRIKSVLEKIRSVFKLLDWIIDVFRYAEETYPYSANGTETIEVPTTKDVVVVENENLNEK